MAEMSEVTKKYKTQYTIAKILSIILTVGPLLYYGILGFSIAEPVKRVVLSLTAIGAIIFTLISVVFKLHIRSTIFLLMLGIHCCIDNITGLIIVMAATTLLDELVATPMCKYCKNKYSINREIDKRL